MRVHCTASSLLVLVLERWPASCGNSSLGPLQKQLAGSVLLGVGLGVGDSGREEEGGYESLTIMYHTELQNRCHV